MQPITNAPFVITREFRAPRALLWQVQTQAEHLQHWLSPEGFSTIHADMDFCVGGRYHYGLEGPNGLQMWGMQKFLGSSQSEGLSISKVSRTKTVAWVVIPWPRHGPATCT